MKLAALVLVDVLRILRSNEQNVLKIFEIKIPAELNSLDTPEY